MPIHLKLTINIVQATAMRWYHARPLDFDDWHFGHLRDALIVKIRNFFTILSPHVNVVVSHQNTRNWKFPFCLSPRRVDFKSPCPVHFPTPFYLILNLITHINLQTWLLPWTWYYSWFQFCHPYTSNKNNKIL